MRIKILAFRTEIENESESENDFESWKLRTRLQPLKKYDRAHVRQGGPEPVERQPVGVRAPPLGTEQGLHVQGADGEPEGAGARPGDHRAREVRIYFKMKNEN